MSKERKFHELIEQQEREEKNRVWEKIKQADSIFVTKEEKQSSTSYFKNMLNRRVLVACTSIIAVVAISVFSAVYLWPNEMTVDNSAVTSSVADSTSETIRYCDSNAYSLSVSDKTFKQLGEDLLYLDWYDVTDYYATSVYQFKETKETIGYYEEIIDINTGSLISIHNIYNEYDLESLQLYTTANQTTEINGVEIKWDYTTKYSYANFLYGEYECFVVVEYPISEGSILDILNELLA